MQLSGFERRADKIAVAPDQATPTHRAEIVERNAELERQDAQAVQCNAGALVCDVADATYADAFLPGEEHQHAAIDRRAADSASLDFTGRRLKDFPERRHAGGYQRENATKPFATSKNAITKTRSTGGPSGIA